MGAAPPPLESATDVTSGGSSPQHLGARPHGERGGASIYRGSEGRAPSGVQGQSSWSGSQRGEAPPSKLKHFWSLDVQWKPQIGPLFYNLETQKICVTFVLS